MSATNGRAFDRVVIIIFENEYRNYVRQNPYMRTLAARGIEMANYFGVMHPSNTNYVASIAGEICNSSEDPSFYTLMPAPPLPPPPTPLTQQPIVDLIEGRGLSWNAYMDSYKPVEFPPQLTPVMSKTDPTKVDQPATVKHTILDYPPYLNMHNPFVRFQSIMENKDQWTRIKTANDFLRDALNNALPEYSWFTPDIWDDGHWLFGTYTEPGERGPVLVNQLSKWLESFFGILSFPGPASRIPPGTLVVVTFDESDFNQSYETIEGQGSDYDGPNQIYTVLLGDMIKPGIEQEGYNHYSLLKTIERNFGLGDLGKNDAGANWFQFLWGERFHWNTPAATPVTAAGALAAEGFEDALYVVYGGAGGSLSYCTYAFGAWSEGKTIPGISGVSAAEMAACGGELVLVCQTGGGLSALTYKPASGWSSPQSVVAQASGSFAVASFLDYGDQSKRVMLAYAVTGNAINSQVYANGAWSAPVNVGQQTDGDMEIAVIGPSIYLIHKAVGSNEMNVVSYNTAPFNVVTIAPPSGSTVNDNDTTQYQWSPSEFPVAHFGYGPNRKPGESEPLLCPYQGVAPFAAATLQGVVHLAHLAVAGPQVQTETFSISGILTPLMPVSYNKNATGNSNGYGTLAEAGWSRQEAIAGATNASGGAMAMARFGSHLALLFQPQAGGPLQISVGRYAKAT